MHPVNLIAKALRNSEDCPKLPYAPTDGICAATGDLGPCVQRKDLFGKSFTDISFLAAPGSPCVSVDAYVALKYKWERQSSWICDGKIFKRLDRQGVRNHVFQDHSYPFCAYATTSYKKHGALRAVVNTGGKNVWLFETRIVDCSNREQLFVWWEKLNSMLRVGVGRSVLERLDCPAWLIKRIGPSRWIKFEAWARPRNRSALYSFLCYLLPSQKEMGDDKKQTE